ncbi:MAG: hypothetical protein J6A16_08015 [Oscillospiraceae bacterium]|nr:hypothetical protein [Oscillospiraceae bacterium]
MAMTEKAALARVLHALRTLYSMKCGCEDTTVLLDSFSAALSHCGNTERPLGKCMGALKRELKAANREFYRSVKKFLSRMYPVLEYDYERALPHIPAIIYGNDRLCAELEKGDKGKAVSMSDALKSYPGFIFGEFGALTPMQFYDLVFGFYPKLYDEPFMDEMKHLFE